MKILAVSFLSLLLYACNLKKECSCCETTKEQEENHLTIFLEKLKKYKDLNEIPFYKAHNLYGKPFYTESFMLNPETTIYQRELLKEHYSLKSIEKDSVRIYETTWDATEEYYITAWYEDIENVGLKVIDTLIWKKGTEW